MDSKLVNRFGGERINDRQVDELIGLAKGIAADGQIHQAEVEFLQKWLAANIHVSDHPLIAALYDRINAILADGIVDEDEKAELLECLQQFTGPQGELGEALKATTLPLCRPAPVISIPGSAFCFTGTFTFGKRGECERSVVERGGTCGTLTQKTNYLVIGTYVTDAWKHSNCGTKILKAVEMRTKGIPISIVSEDHWLRSL